MTRKTTIEIICGLLILLFLYTGISKWLNFSEFIHDMHNQPFPGWLVQLIILMLPAVEILIAVTLMFVRTRPAGLWGAFTLMSVFTLYAAAILMHFFNRVPCSCGGIIQGLTWTQHLFFNLFFTAISAIGLTLSRKILNLEKDVAWRKAGAASS